MTLKPEDRPWRDILMERYEEKERTTFKRSKGMLPRFQFNAYPVFMRAVDAAATTLGYDRSSYIRRVLAIHVAHTLGFSLKALLHACPEPKPPRLPGEQHVTTKKSDDGAAIEWLCPHPGCDGEHLREAVSED